MRELLAAAGGHSSRKLAKESKKVVRRYQDRWELRELASTTVNDVLNRQRVKPPPWPWLASYVLTCRHLAAKTPGHALLSEDEEQVLITWQARWRTAQANSVESAGRNGRRRSADPADHQCGPRNTSSMRAIHGEQAEPSTEGLGPAPPPATPTANGGPHADDVDPDRGCREDSAGLTLTQQRFAAAYGPHGLELIAAAEDHHEPDASYRIGLLLLLDRSHWEGVEWLIKAEHDGQRQCAPWHRRSAQLATELIELGTMSRAIEQAAELGDAAAAANDLMTATVYYQRAAANGHPEGTRKLAMVYRQLGDRRRAAEWDRRADAAGYPQLKTASEVPIRHEPLRESTSTPREGLPSFG